MTRIITITSGKGGVGKTTVTANLGTALALQGKRVCLIDADFGLRNLDIPLGLTNRIIYDLGNYLDGLCELKQVLIRDQRMPGLYFLPGSKELNNEIGPDEFREIVLEISRGFDFVLIDSPAGIEYGFHNAVHCANEAIIVTTPHITSIRDADRVIGLLEEKMSSEPKLILNMGEEESDGSLDVDDVIDILRLELLGTVEKDSEIIRYVHRGIPIALHPQSDSGARFHHMSQCIIENECKPYSPTELEKNQQKGLPLLKWIKSL